MTVSIHLPPAIEEQLRQTVTDVDQVSKEAALVEFYRMGKLTHHELATALGLDRFETEALLKRRNVTEDLLSLEAYAEQLNTAHGLSTQ